MDHLKEKSTSFKVSRIYNQTRWLTCFNKEMKTQTSFFLFLTCESPIKPFSSIQSRYETRNCLNVEMHEHHSISITNHLPSFTLLHETKHIYLLSRATDWFDWINFYVTELKRPFLSTWSVHNDSMKKIHLITGIFLHVAAFSSFFYVCSW